MALIVGGTTVTGTQTLDATKLTGNLPSISGASLTGVSGAIKQVKYREISFTQNTGSMSTQNYDLSLSSCDTNNLVRCHYGVYILSQGEAGYPDFSVGPQSGLSRMQSDHWGFGRANSRTDLQSSTAQNRRTPQFASAGYGEWSQPDSANTFTDKSGGEDYFEIINSEWYKIDSSSVTARVTWSASGSGSHTYYRSRGYMVMEEIAATT